MLRRFISDLFQSSQPPSDLTLADLSETSMNFDQENVMPFLRSLIGATGVEVAVSGLQDVETALNRMEVNETRSFILNPAIGLKLEIFMDDIQAPDLYFMGPSVEIERIDDALIAFVEKLGL